jgi:hypothetical protein
VEGDHWCQWQDHLQLPCNLRFLVVSGFSKNYFLNLTILVIAGWFQKGKKCQKPIQRVRTPWLSCDVQCGFVSMFHTKKWNVFLIRQILNGWYHYDAPLILVLDKIELVRVLYYTLTSNLHCWEILLCPIYMAEETPLLQFQSFLYLGFAIP